MIDPWMKEASERVQATFAGHGVRLTLGGEPTFIPINPEGAEWKYSAVGPTKLAYARKFADALMQSRLAGAARFFCPGKLYPGETNPRWAVRLLANRDGKPLFRLPKRGKLPTPQSAQQVADAISKYLGVPSHWIALTDPKDDNGEVLAMPLDHDGELWHSAKWPLAKADRKLSEAEGPAGLRMPLYLLPPHLPRRALCIERKGNTVTLFLPPVLQRPMLQLLSAVEQAARQLSLSNIELQGYTPADEENRWTVLGLAADPGVLEINLPACRDWQEYAEWMETLHECAAKVGLRSWKETPWDHPEGSGGGNHLLWGGPNLDEHPFFSRPAWLASILRFWQHHPSLAYIFTGCYVGASSQAPRPDESARDLYDIEMAYAFLESLPEGDHRGLINETLRHIQTDVTGNSHRSEISFDKFWNTASPSGALGLTEFRAIEALPHASWSNAIALLWSCLAADLLEHKTSPGLKRYGTKLHDEYFLPARLWEDFSEILDRLAKHGFKLQADIYREIWNWRFPVLLDWKKAAAKLTIRKSLESWPLLCETPLEGGTTSRFVDTSMQRLEFVASAAFLAHYQIYVAGRPLALSKTDDGQGLAGLRYRRTNLYPSLHPGIPTQLPLYISIVNTDTGRVAAEYRMTPEEIVFHLQEKPGAVKIGDHACRGGRSGDLTYDLRLD